MTWTRFLRCAFLIGALGRLQRWKRKRAFFGWNLCFSNNWCMLFREKVRRSRKYRVLTDTFYLLTIKGAKTLFYGLGHGFFRVKPKSRNDILPQFLQSYCRSEQIFARGNYHWLTRITQKTHDVLSKSQLIALELQTIFFVQYWLLKIHRLNAFLEDMTLPLSCSRAKFLKSQEQA